MPSKPEIAEWTEVIEPSPPVFDLRLAQLWRYRDLIAMLVRRDFVANYKQTILGPLWFVLQPALTSLTYALVFGRAAGLGPGKVPMLVFYLSGVTVWNYFSDCLTKTATVFKDNASMFGKVYFPRLVMPVAIVISNLMKFAVQLGLFLLVWGYYLVIGRVPFPNAVVLLIPLLIALMGLMGLGAGMIISALTTKYKDLVFLISFGVQLLMFSTPVIIPLERIPARFHWVVHANPLSSIIEGFRYAFAAGGSFSWRSLGISSVCALALVTFGAAIFNRVERTFSDTV
jgi:lipopolysaccharide transport system permease protein